MFDIQKQELNENIVVLRFETQYELCSTFLRIQEFYESPFKQIRKKYFTLEQYMDLYAKEYGNFTYTLDWSGFNIPDTKIREFFDVFGKNLLEKEKHFKKLISNKLRKNKKFYIIGDYSRSDLNAKKLIKERFNTFSHEIAHGLYYLNSKYRNDMIELIECINEKTKKKITNKLLDWGYHKSVIDDEIQAYLSTSTGNYLKRKLKVNVIQAAENFAAVFIDHCSKVF